MERQEIADFARSFVGFGFNNHRDEYLDLLASDVESSATRNDMASMSSCALVVRGIWRKLGCDHQILKNKYRIGRAMSDVVEIARSFDAWHSPSDDYVADIGDVVIVGKPSSEHVYTIVEISGDDNNEYTSVDGGQGPGGKSIDLCYRKWELVNGILTDINNFNSKRPIIGIVDVMKLF